MTEIEELRGRVSEKNRRLDELGEEVVRLRGERDELLAACRVALKRIALLTPLADDDATDPLGQIQAAVARRCDEAMATIHNAIRRAEGKPPVKFPWAGPTGPG